MQQVQPGEWRRFGFGGPPEPWEHGAQRDLDRLATSYYLDILGSRRAILAACRDEALRDRVEDRLGSLMRTGMRLREIRDSLPSSGPVSPAPEPMPAA